MVSLAVSGGWAFLDMKSDLHFFPFFSCSLIAGSSFGLLFFLLRLIIINLPFIDRSCVAKYKFLLLKNHLLVCPDFHRLPQKSDIDLNGNPFNCSCLITANAFFLYGVCVQDCRSYQVRNYRLQKRQLRLNQFGVYTKEPYASTNQQCNHFPAYRFYRTTSEYEYTNFTPSDL